MMKTTMFVLAASVVPAYSEEVSSLTQWCARNDSRVSLPAGIDNAYCQQQCFWNNVLRTNLCKQDEQVGGFFQYYHYCTECPAPESTESTAVADGRDDDDADLQQDSSSIEWCARIEEPLPASIDDEYCRVNCLWFGQLRNFCKQEGPFEHYHYCTQCQAPESTESTAVGGSRRERRVAEYDAWLSTSISSATTHNN